MSEKKHILLVGHSPNLHGAEYSLLRLIEFFKDHAELEVLAPGEGAFEAEVKRLQVPFVPFSPLYPFALKGENRSALPAFLDRLNRNVITLKDRFKRVDLVHSNTLYVWEGAALAAEWGCPHLWNVREVCGASPTWNPAFGWPLTLEWLKDLSDGLVAVSGAAKMGLGPDLEEMTRVIHNGLDIEPMPKEKSRLWMESTWSLRSTDKVILTVGNLIPEKGHGLWLKAVASMLKKHSNWHLVWVGEKGLCRRTLLQEIQALGLETQVHLVGGVEGIGKKMAGADLYVLPSVTEAFPTVLLEARACGLPFLATACGGTLEISREGGGQECANHEELAKLSEAFLEGKLKVPDARKGAFTMDDMAEGYWQVYQGLKVRALETKRQRWEAIQGLSKDLIPAKILQNRVDRLRSKRGIGRLFRRIFPR